MAKLVVSKLKPYLKIWHDYDNFFYEECQQCTGLQFSLNISGLNSHFVDLWESYGGALKDAQNGAQIVPGATIKHDDGDF